jgi:hypothetical protein
LSSRISGDPRIHARLWKEKIDPRKTWVFGVLNGIAKEKPSTPMANKNRNSFFGARDFKFSSSPQLRPFVIETRAVVQMGKKNKDEVPKPNNVVNRDILQRLNFLYQASVYLESISRQCRGSALAQAGSSGDNAALPVDDLSTQPIAQPSALLAAGAPTMPLLKATGRRRHREQPKGRVICASDIGQGYVRAMRLIGQKATVKM